MNAFDLMNKLSVIYDARQQWKVDHKLSDILLLTICAVIAGCEGWEEIEDFGNERLDWLRNYGEFEYGIPSHHTQGKIMKPRTRRGLQTDIECSWLPFSAYASNLL